MKRQPSQAAIERAWRIRQLSRGAKVQDATEAERRAAVARKKQQQDQDVSESGASKKV